MVVVPRCRTKRFAECAPGELIRLMMRGEPCLALVAQGGEQHHLVVLTGEHMLKWGVGPSDPQAKLPRYMPLQPHDITEDVLSYERNYTVEVDHGGPFGMAGHSDLSSRNGVLVVADTSTLLRVRAVPLLDLAPPIHVGLPDGAVAGRLGGHAVFGNWAIYPGQASEWGQRPAPLFSHSVA